MGPFINLLSKLGHSHLLRNISIYWSMHGTRLIITQLSSNFHTEDHLSNHEIRCFTIKGQFPLKPCYAMTIIKVKDNLLKIVGIFSSRPSFHPRTALCALSESLQKGLKIISVTMKPPFYLCKNIVYKNYKRYS
uniref:Uncharacterized protein n=1 Tax=Salix viminalis TaxID=40686 RepID=A0A6N2N9P7_SALVM